jgi:hypothetical protein
MRAVSAPSIKSIEKVQGVDFTGIHPGCSEHGLVSILPSQTNARVFSLATAPHEG